MVMIVEPEYVRRTARVSNSPEYLFEFTVRGAGQFPMDMLRVERAWPAGPTSALGMDGDQDAPLRKVTLCCINWNSAWIPHLDCWIDAGWEVLRRS